MFETLLNYHIYVYQVILLFGIFSGMGWIVETVYRSAANRRFVNAGYLYGPFVPIYGMGGVIIIILGIFIQREVLYVQMICFALLTTVLELVIGLLLKKVFGHRLWDYSENRFNFFGGTICLKYSLIWMILSWLFFYFIFPLTYIAINRIDPSTVRIAALVFSGYFIIDLLVSTIAMIDLFHRIEFVYQGFASLKRGELQSKLSRFNRIFEAFPYLNGFLEKEIDQGLRTSIKGLLKKIGARRYRKTIYAEREFFNIVKEILDNPEYQKLKGYFHHYSSIYDHAQSVAYLSYKIAKVLNLDYMSTARGALLHDFFLYDWRTHDHPDLPAEKYHGFEHPKIALENSRKHFPINKIEEDIIVKHMWPITIIPPRYRESYVVTFADKYLSSKEYTVRARDTIKRKGSEAVRKISAKRKKRKTRDVK
jgi:uncharacterized membrane protein/HD superfamily phosphodiesterase